MSAYVSKSISYEIHRLSPGINTTTKPGEESSYSVTTTKDIPEQIKPIDATPEKKKLCQHSVHVHY